VVTHTGPTIGVVIPAYNAARWIDASLAGVAAQEVAPHRVVVVDDASTDGTAEIARRWAAVLPLEVVRMECNAGAGAARSVAIECLDTDLVAFLDADDVWLPHHLAHLTLLHQRNGGLVCAKCLELWPDGRLTTRRLSVPATHQLRRLVERNYVFGGVLFSRVDVTTVGGIRSRPLVEDWDLWIRLVAAGAEVTEGAVVTVLYRRHTENLTNRQTKVLKAGHDLLVELGGMDLGLPRAVVRRGLRSIRGELALERAAELFAQGRSLRARAVALRALRGRPRLKLGALAVLLAPNRQAARLARRGYPSIPPS
jgi:glycosyltransferase involved in cell wall biosynthesis